MLRVFAVAVVISMFTTVFMGLGLEPTANAAGAAPVSPFSAPVRINDIATNTQGLPVIAKTPEGSLAVAWEDDRNVLDKDDIFVATSVSGTSFSANVRADGSFGSSEQIRPAIAISNGGSILLAWQDNRASTFDYDIYFAKSEDGGLTFSRSVKVDDGSGNISWQERPSIAVTANGIIYIAWTDDRAGPGLLRLRGAYSTNGGASFSASAEIVSNGSMSGQSCISLAFSGNRLFAAFIDTVSGTPHPYICSSTNGGKSFTAPVRLDSTGSSNATQRGLFISPVPGGGIAAIWEDARNGEWDIYASIVSYKGVVSTTDMRVDDDTSRSWQHEPAIAADQLGNLYAAWRDDRDSNYAIRFSYLEAGGDKFNASIEISRPGPNDMQREPSLVALSPGRVVVVWQDDVAGTYDVYASVGLFPSMFGMTLLEGWNLISIPSDGFVYKASTLGLKTGDIVSSWNSTLQTFDKTYIVGLSPPPTDFVLSPSTGYWVKTITHERIKLNGTIPSTIQSKRISVPGSGGWEIIGFESLNTTRFASDIPKMHSVPGGITTVCRFNPTTMTYDTYVVGAPMTDFSLKPGDAYYCYCAVSGTITYDP